jgi:hypothetical protein
MAQLQRLTINDTGNLTLPVGTTVQRPNNTVVVQSFTAVGTTSWTAPAGVSSVEVLVVAGGGGGASRHGGGGGAGGLIYRSNYPVTSGSSYTVTVGGGGAGAASGSSTIGTNGGNSVFDSLTAIGGGYGSSDSISGGSGGSGGGGRGNSNTPGGSAIQGQGFPGGRGTTQSPIIGGGGGGAGGPGSPGGAGPGNGGNGLLFSITGTPVWYAGGGGGGASLGAAGGLGGGDGNLIAAVDSATAGPPNTGGGGGAGGHNDGTNWTGKAGGSGIVVLRYSRSSENTDPVSQTRYNSISNSIEFYGKTNSWITNPTDQDLLNQGLILNFDASKYVSGSIWKDISGNNFDGSIVGSPAHSTNNQGYFTFNSSSQRVVIPNNSTLQGMTRQVTINAWAYINSYTDFDTIFWKSNNGNSGNQASYGLSLATGRLPRFTAANTECIGTRPLQLNEWVNLTGVFDNGQITLYVNGEIAAEQVGPITITTSAEEMAIGDRRFNNASIHPFNGRIAICQLYHRALSDSEIKQIYQSYFPRFEVKSPAVDKTKIVVRGLMMNIDAGNRSSVSGINDSIVYETSKGNHGNLVNGGIWTPDRRDRGSIYFDETARAHISMRNPSNGIRIDSEMTYELWFRPTSYAGRTRFYLFDLRGDGSTPNNISYFLYDIISGTTVRYTVLGGSANETLSSNVDQPLNIWHHAMAVKTAQNWRIFLNGVRIANSDNAGTAPFSVNTAYRIATYSSATPFSAEFYFAGYIAAARIYEVALTDSEIIQNYRAFRTRYGN